MENTIRKILQHMVADAERCQAAIRSKSLQTSTKNLSHDSSLSTVASGLLHAIIDG
jgi:hypothetical protein